MGDIAHCRLRIPIKLTKLIRLGSIDVLIFVSFVTFFAKKVTPKNCNCQNSIYQHRKMGRVL